MKRSHRRSAEAAALYHYRRECIDHRDGRHCRTDFLPGTLVIQKIRTRGCGFLYYFFRYVVSAGTDSVMNVQPPMVAFLPSTVSPPRMVAPA